MRYLCTSIVATLVLAGTTLAATINVPADYPTIQAAVDAASDGDEILVAPGTYTGSGNEVVDMRGKVVWLHSIDGPEATIISGMNKQRGILCETAERNNTIIEGFTIRDCLSDCCGAGISCSPGSPTIKNCIIVENYSSLGGGGVYCRSFDAEVSSPAIINCWIENNVAGSNGGGVYVYPNCSPTITGCTISGNIAGDIHAGAGGGIRCDGTPTITGSRVCGNFPDQILGAWATGGNGSQNNINTSCSSCPGDTDGNGVVDIEDLLNMMGSWGACP